MPPSPINRRIAARLHQTQLDLTDWTDTLSAKMAAVYSRCLQSIVEAAASESYSTRRARVRSAIQQAHTDAYAYLEEQYIERARHAHDKAADVLLQTVPVRWWRKLVPPRLQEDISLPFTAIDELEPIRGWPDNELSREEALDLIREALFPALDRATVGRIIASPGANGIAWPERMELLTKLADPDTIARHLEDGISAGENTAELRERIRPDVNMYAPSAQRIARTEGRRIANVAQQEVFRKAGDLISGMQIMATMDQWTRPAHAARNGKIYDRQDDGSFVAKDGEELPVLPDEPNCVLPGQLASGQFVGGLRAVYAGQVIEIRTMSKRTLTVTPNHRILTVRGWIAAGELLHEDELLCDCLIVPRNNNSSLAGAFREFSNDTNDEPVLIEQVLKSLRNRQSIVIAGRAMVDFHGDERFLESDVEIVGTDRKLLLHNRTQVNKGRDNPSFQRGNMELLGVASGSAGQLSGVRVNLTATGSIGGADLPSDDGGVCLHAPPLQKLSIGPTANLHAHFLEQPGNGDAGNPDLIRELLHGSSGQVATDKIIGIRRYEFRGHVYDLQSTVGWLSINGIIISNCRCIAIPVLKEPEEIQSDPLVAADFENAAGDEIPDPAAYTEWFSGASEAAQQEAVGKRRYDYMVEKLKAYAMTPAWNDFLEPKTGQLMPLKALKAETATAHVARRAAVDKLLLDRQMQFIKVAQRGFLPEPPPVLNPEVQRVRSVGRFKKHTEPGRKVGRFKNREYGPTERNE